MSEFDIDVSGATEALNAIGGFSAAQATEVHGGVAPDQNPPAVTPESTTDEGTTTPTETPAATEPVVVPETGQDTIIPRADLDSLLAGIEDPAARTAVETAYKSFQGGFTKKSQELAEQRKQLESFGPLDAVQEALELRNALQDPRQWQSLHAELTQGLQAMGMTPAAAAAAASDQLAEATQEVELPDLSALEDPELSPFKAHIEKLHEELNGIRSEWANQREQERLAQVQTAMVGELQRQENLIRETAPDLKDDDITSVWEMSAFYDGNLIEAHQQLEAYAQRRFEAYLAKKQSPAVVPAIPTPVAGADTLTESAKVATNLDDAHAAAMERLRLVESQG